MAYEFWWINTMIPYWYFIFCHHIICRYLLYHMYSYFWTLSKALHCKRFAIIQVEWSFPPVTSNLDYYCSMHISKVHTGRIHTFLIFTNVSILFVKKYGKESFNRSHWFTWAALYCKNTWVRIKDMMFEKSIAPIWVTLKKKKTKESEPCECVLIPSQRVNYKCTLVAIAHKTPLPPHMKKLMESTTFYSTDRLWHLTGWASHIEGQFQYRL